LTDESWVGIWRHIGDDSTARLGLRSETRWTNANGKAPYYTAFGELLAERRAAGTVPLRLPWRKFVKVGC